MQFNNIYISILYKIRSLTKSIIYKKQEKEINVCKHVTGLERIILFHTIIVYVFI